MFTVHLRKRRLIDIAVLCCCPCSAAGTDKLLGAEAATVEAGGNVLRLVGLYHASRGPHTFFIKQGEVARWGGYTVNMLHYEDAARIAMAVLAGDGSEEGKGWRGQVFVGTDGHPLTFQEMVDACFASGLFSGSVKFTGEWSVHAGSSMCRITQGMFSGSVKFKREFDRGTAELFL